MTEANNNLLDLFGQETQATTSNSQGKTAQLTIKATAIADEILRSAAAAGEEIIALVSKSKESHEAMDELIEKTYDLSTVDNEFLKSESTDALEKMLKSQQSKRSRAKSKIMTKDNYLSMLTGAIAEHILRMALNKPKSAGGGARSVDVEYTAEELAEFESDPEKLKKAIRNIQSKKSIMKSKADFDESSEKWNQLVTVEAILIDIRDNTKAGMSVEAQKAIDKVAKIEEAISGLSTEDIDKLKAVDAKSTLQLIKDLLTSN